MLPTHIHKKLATTMKVAAPFFKMENQLLAYASFEAHNFVLFIIENNVK
jgi:hypothetical protein